LPDIGVRGAIQRDRFQVRLAHHTWQPPEIHAGDPAAGTPAGRRPPAKARDIWSPRCPRVRRPRSNGRAAAATAAPSPALETVTWQCAANAPLLHSESIQLSKRVSRARPAIRGRVPQAPPIPRSSHRANAHAAGTQQRAVRPPVMSTVADAAAARRRG
jgi:hypothetical protein